MKSNPDCTDTQPYNSIDIEGSALSVHDGETVLETLERFKVEVNYNCREGFCGVCRTKLLSGTVEYKIEPLAFIDDDEILSCCSLPTSNISIKVNV